MPYSLANYQKKAFNNIWDLPFFTIRIFDANHVLSKYRILTGESHYLGQIFTFNVEILCFHLFSLCSQVVNLSQEQDIWKTEFFFFIGESAKLLIKSIQLEKRLNGFPYDEESYTLLPLFFRIILRLESLFHQIL